MGGAFPPGKRCEDRNPKCQKTDAKKVPTALAFSARSALKNASMTFLVVADWRPRRINPTERWGSAATIRFHFSDPIFLTKVCLEHLSVRKTGSEK
jgi:hypothetical protein